jgi:hypothetical protein
MATLTMVNGVVRGQREEREEKVKEAVRAEGGRPRKQREDS